LLKKERSIGVCNLALMGVLFGEYEDEDGEGAGCGIGTGLMGREGL